METAFDRSAPRKPTNVTVNSDLLRQARELEINLSRALEDRLVELVVAERRKRWLAENREAVEDYNRRVEAKGAFSDRMRRF